MPDQALRDLQNVEIFVRKLQAQAGRGAAGVSTYSSLCTSACFSSASTICASGALAAASSDPELAQVFATLHKRGIEVLGEDGLMEAMIDQSKANKPINVFELAEKTK